MGSRVGFRVTMETINVEATHTFRKLFEFDHTFKVTKVKELFSGFDPGGPSLGPPVLS